LIHLHHHTIYFNLNKPKSLVFLKTENAVMKKFTILLMAFAIGVALYEQTSTDKNVYVMVIAIVIFMMGMMKLSSKTPSKNQDKEDDNV
jgi:L-asparagine transporter-like permease